MGHGTGVGGPGLDKKGHITRVGVKEHKPKKNWKCKLLGHKEHRILSTTDDGGTGVHVYCVRCGDSIAAWVYPLGMEFDLPKKNYVDLRK